MPSSFWPSPSSATSPWADNEMVKELPLVPRIQGPLPVRTYVDCCMRLVYRFRPEHRPVEVGPEQERGLAP
ncbi:hypothetical protein FBY34_8244 [Streptomyces sp. SLBN-115]|nr:hypothetical protein FBY34_8244 [Streptomyces sp. SLBN-115]